MGRETASEILGWMHIALIGRGRQILAEQLETIEASGLLEASGGKVHACVTGPMAPPRLPPWLVVVRREPDWRQGENPTLRALLARQRASPSRYVWYIHTKGASYSRGDAWRHYLEYFTLWRWRDNLDALRAGYDAAGVDWVTPNTRGAERFMGHRPTANAFLGNFWWSTGKHVAGLRDKLTRNRYDAEWQFIGQNNPRVKCLHFSGNNHYVADYPKEKYQSEDDGGRRQGS